MGLKIITDYTTLLDTFLPGIFQQYRLKKYFRDVLLNWLSLPENILDNRIRKMLFQSNGLLKRLLIRVDTPFDKDSKYAGSTPSVVISGGPIQYLPRLVTLGPAWPAIPTMRSAFGHTRKKSISLVFSVVALDYDLVDLLTLLLLLFLLVNANSIVKDCPMLSSFDVLRLDAPTAVETSMHSKQVYSCSIHTQATGYVGWTEDTQGPVFKGLTKKVNFNSNN